MRISVKKLKRTCYHLLQPLSRGELQSAMPKSTKGIVTKKLMNSTDHFFNQHMSTCTLHPDCSSILFTGYMEADMWERQ